MNLFLERAEIFLLGIQFLEFQEVNVVKGSVKQNARQNVMLQGSQEKVSFYIYRIY